MPIDSFASSAAGQLTRLSTILLEYNHAAEHIDAFAIAPYFYVHERQQAEVRSTEDVFKLLKDDRNAYAIQNVLTMVQKQADLAKQYGVKLIAYEGGQHLVDRKSRVPFAISPTRNTSAQTGRSQWKPCTSSFWKAGKRLRGIACSWRFQHRALIRRLTAVGG